MMLTPNQLPLTSMAKRTKSNTDGELSLARWVFIAHKSFQFTIERRFQSGMDEIAPEQFADRTGIPLQLAKDAFAELRTAGCIEVASTGQAVLTRYRAVLPFKMPELALEYLASKGKA